MKGIAKLKVKDREELFQATALSMGLPPNVIEQDITFKQKFYYAKGANYETATLKDIVLLPKQEIVRALKEDYHAMRNMIYGEMPTFEELLEFLETLQKEVHELENNGQIS